MKNKCNINFYGSTQVQIISANKLCDINIGVPTNNQLQRNCNHCYYTVDYYISASDINKNNTKYSEISKSYK